MTDESTTDRRFATIVVVLTVLVGMGMMVSLAGGTVAFSEHENNTSDDVGDNGETDVEDNGENETTENETTENETNETGTQKTVTVEDLEADRVHLEQVTVQNLTVDISQLRDEGAESVVEDSVEESMAGDVEGFAVESVEVEGVSSADITVEDDVATINAEVDSVTLEGVSADSVTMQHGAQGQQSEMADEQSGDAQTQSRVVEGMMSGVGVHAERIVIEDVSIGSIVIEQAEEEPAETPTETPDDNETETPTETPDDNETETPTETPDDNETETPDDNESDVPVFEPPEDNETDNETETPDDNETEMPTDNETVDDEEPTASVQFSEQSSNGTVVTVDEVNMSEGGFVAIHDASLLEGNAIGSVVGVSDHLESGTQEDVNVTLFDVPGADFDETELSEDQTLIAMAHFDSNDNGTYDFVTTEGEADGPYIEDEEVVTDSANVTVESDATNESESIAVLP